MKRVQAYIRTNRLEAVKSELERRGIMGMSVEEVRGFGRQQGTHEAFRGSSYALNLVPKTRIETIVPDDLAEDAIQAILAAAQTGELGDGKIFVSEVQAVVRISTGERDEDALT